MSLDVTCLDEVEFAALRESWGALLAQSAADPLFLSWEWQWSWWRSHKSLLSAQLLLLAVRQANGELVGLAPFYRRPVRHRPGLKGHRIELIGLAWREDTLAFSEYLDIIVRPDHVQDVLADLGAFLMGNGDWDEIVFGYLRPGSLAAALVSEQLRRRTTTRRVDPLDAYAIDLRDGFAVYARRLRSGTRRRLLSQRRKLLRPRLKMAEADEIRPLLKQLWEYKSSRWGGQVSPAVAQFHFEFATEMARCGQLRLSALQSGGQVISVLYDVRIGDTEYYLQSGIDGGAASGISPGYLHFGYAIERACSEGVLRFDLLAGPGLNRDYKNDLCTERSTLVCLQTIRRPVLRALQAAWAIVGRRMQS